MKTWIGRARRHFFRLLIFGARTGCVTRTLPPHSAPGVYFEFARVADNVKFRLSLNDLLLKIQILIIWLHVWIICRELSADYNGERFIQFEWKEQKIQRIQSAIVQKRLANLCDVRKIEMILIWKLRRNSKFWDKQTQRRFSSSWSRSPCINSSFSLWD